VASGDVESVQKQLSGNPGAFDRSMQHHLM